jgi:hypothetical protein
MDWGYAASSGELNRIRIKSGLSNQGDAYGKKGSGDPVLLANSIDNTFGNG